MQKRRRRNRNHETSCLLFSPDCANGPRFLRRISYAKGVQMVKDRRAVEYKDLGRGEHLGFQLLQNEAALTKPVASKPMPSLDPSRSTFTRAEVDAIEMGAKESHTIRLSDDQKEWRVKNGLPEMDLIEASLAKQAHYQYVH